MSEFKFQTQNLDSSAETQVRLKSTAYRQWAEEHRDLTGDDYANAVEELAAKGAAYDEGDRAFVMMTHSVEHPDGIEYIMFVHTSVPLAEGTAYRIVREVEDE